VRGNSFGKLLTITTFGESHGVALGAVVDGVPPGLNFSLDDLAIELKKRAPGQLPGTTARKEDDLPEVLSGIFEGKTLGTPICVIVRNTNQRSKDYDKIKDDYRPGHADKTYIQKYGIRDHRGGGRSSGRETLSRVIGGYFASLIIPNIEFEAKISRMGKLTVPLKHQSKAANNYGIPHFSNEEVEKYLLDLKAGGDSCGGEVGLQIRKCPPGLGEPAFDKLKSDMAKALMSIGAVVGVTLGAGTEFLEKSGKEISKESDNFGGIEGGISNGSVIRFSIFIKPTSTVGEKAKEGRHDPCILPRVLPVICSMAKLVIADHYLRQKAYEKVEDR
jgi:chorismate synthase